MCSNPTVEYVDVLWKDVLTRRNFKVGVLYKDKKYVFAYDVDGVSAAQECGFNGLVAFPDLSAEYTNDELFPVFENRLPDKRRKDLPDVLKRYGLQEYDAFELLKKTGGKTPTDTISFAESIILSDEVDIVREFNIAGVRHCNVCNGKADEECTIQIELIKGDRLKLTLEPKNDKDPYAVAVYKATHKVGYIPSNYCKQVFGALKEGREVECTIIEFDKNNCCQECLKVSLLIKAMQNS